MMVVALLVMTDLGGGLRRRRHGMLVVNAVDVRLDGAKLVDRDRGASVAQQDASVVRLPLDGIEIHTLSPEVANQLALALTTGIPRATVKHGIPFLPALNLFMAIGALFFALVSLLVRFGHLSFLLPSLCAGFLATLLSFASFRRLTRFTIGADGLRVGWSKRGRFHAWDEVRDVRVTPKSVVLVMANGREVPLRVSVPTAIANLIAGRRTEFAARRAQRDANHDGHAARDGLARGGAAPAAWVTKIRQLGERASYRDAAVPASAFWSLLEDPTSRPSIRVAAAIAVAEKLTPEERVRLRVAGTTSVCPKLRVALEHVADGAEVTAALAELAEDEAERDRRHA
jgi:hypothetical protein